MSRVCPPCVLLFLPLLVACDGKGGATLPDYDAGHATACLEVGDGSIAESETQVVDITGTFYDDDDEGLTGDVHPCNDGASRVMTMIGDDGGVYKLGYGVWDADGKDITPELDLLSGDSLYLHFVSVQSFGDASGFVIQDSESVVAALEDGTWGPALEEGSVPGLSVSAGEIVGSGDIDCGHVEATEISFSGDAERSAEPVSDVLITVGGKALTAYAVASWEYTEATCTDVAGELIWAAFR